MPTHSRTHDECRLAVCLLCLGKTKDMRRINSRQRETINNVFLTGLLEEDERLPCALCGNCRVIIQEYANGNYNRKINLFDHSTIGKQPPRTRSTAAIPCNCIVCVHARSSTTLNFGNVLPKRTRCGPVKATSSTAYVNDSQIGTARPPPDSIKLCSQCLTILKRGKSHLCTKNSRNENILQLANAGTPKSKDKIASSIIKDKIVSAPTSSKAINLATSSGRCLSVSFESKLACAKKQLFSTNDLSAIQVDMNLSNNQTLRLASHIRTATCNRSSIEIGLKQKLIEKNHKLDKFFTSKITDFVHIATNGQCSHTPRSIVYCINSNDLRDYVLEQRNIQNGENYITKIGIDGGGDFLKVCVNIQKECCESELSSFKRTGYHEGVAAKSMKDSSVKKLFIIGIVPNVQENYTNILKVWNLLQLINNDILSNAVISTDLKMTNIILGLMAHSSTHPCSWCNIAKENLVEVGEPRTLGNIIDNFWSWNADGRNKKKAKNHGNCVHMPIVKGHENKKIIDIFPPPELHLLLGPVNHIFNNMTKVWPDAVKWAAACHVERQAMHGGSFNGNSCMTLLNHVDILQQISPITCLKYVKVFRDFRKVVKSCYGQTLDQEYKTDIETFKKSFLELEISVTPKLHAIFHHIPEFCDKQQSGLGPWSEQASEAVHSDFKATWHKYKVPENHSSYAPQLLRAVCEYNAKHV